MHAILTESRRRSAKIMLLVAMALGLCAIVAQAIDIYLTGGSFARLFLPVPVIAIAGLSLALLNKAAARAE